MVVGYETQQPAQSVRLQQLHRLRGPLTFHIPLIAQKYTNMMHICPIGGLPAAQFCNSQPSTDHAYQTTP